MEISAIKAPALLYLVMDSYDWFSGLVWEEFESGFITKPLTREERRRIEEEEKEEEEEEERERETY